MKQLTVCILFGILFLSASLVAATGDPMGPQPIGFLLPTAPPHPPTWQATPNSQPTFAPWPPPTPGPTALPVNQYVVRLQEVTNVYPCPGTCMAMWWLPAGTVVTVQILPQAGWLWLKSGDRSGEFVIDDGSFQRL